MTNAQIWNINPGQGIGSLLFGMTQIQVGQLNGDYGIPSKISAPKDTMTTSVDDIISTLSEFGFDDFPEFEEMNEAAALSNRLAEDKLSGITDEIRVSPETLICQYIENKLFALSTDETNRFVNFNDILIFDSNPKGVLQQFQHSNGGAEVSSSTVLFDKIGVLLSGLYYQGANGAWRFYDRKDALFDERVVTIFLPSERNRISDEVFSPVDFFAK